MGEKYYLVGWTLQGWECYNFIFEVFEKSREDKISLQERIKNILNEIPDATLHVIHGTERNFEIEKEVVKEIKIS